MAPKACSGDRKSTRLNSSHGSISYAVFCLKKKKTVREVSTDDLSGPATEVDSADPRPRGPSLLWRRAEATRVRPRESSSFFFFNDTATTEIYTLSLHDALPI